MNIYFGRWEHKPSHVSETPDKWRRTFPLDMNEAIRQMTAEGVKEFWTNNPYWVDRISYNGLFLCFPNRIISATEHKDFAKLGYLMEPGEFAASISYV